MTPDLTPKLDWPDPLTIKAGPTTLTTMKRLAPIALLALALTACGGGSDSSSSPAETATATVTETTTATVTVTPEPPTVDEVNLKPRDFLLRVKVTGKQCFGSAGCNVEYEIVPTYIGGPVSDLEAVTVDVTYKITGDESGDLIGTVSFDAGNYSVPTGSASTTSDGVELRAKVTEVSAY